MGDKSADGVRKHVSPSVTIKCNSLRIPKVLMCCVLKQAIAASIIERAVRFISKKDALPCH
jgi:hypothetical protein